MQNGRSSTVLKTGEIPRRVLSLLNDLHLPSWTRNKQLMDFPLAYRKTPTAGQSHKLPEYAVPRDIKNSLLLWPSTTEVLV